MRLAVLSDIHGNLAALQAVLADVARQGVDATVNLGDILSGPLQPRDTAELLMGLNLPTIAGNHERQLLALRAKHGLALRPNTPDGFAALQLQERHLHWLQGLPAHLTLNAGRADEVCLVHGSPGNDLLYWLETVTPDQGLRAASAAEATARLGPGVGTATLALCGHSHVPRALCLGALLVVNPGSVGQPAFDDRHPHPHVVENGTPHARYAVVAHGAHGWSVAWHAVAYDAAAQARLAAERGFPDWAQALASGRVRPDAATMPA